MLMPSHDSVTLLQVVAGACGMHTGTWGRGEAGRGSSAGLSTVLLTGEDPNACPHLLAASRVGGLKQSLKEVTSKLNFPRLHARV